MRLRYRVLSHRTIGSIDLDKQYKSYTTFADVIYHLVHILDTKAGLLPWAYQRTILRSDFTTQYRWWLDLEHAGKPTLWVY